MRVIQCRASWGITLGILAGLQACTPCAGKTGAELEQCEVDQEEKGSDGAAGSSTTTPGEGGDLDVSYAGDPPGAPDWRLDNVAGALDGETAVHPPPMDRGDEAVMSFDCGGRAFSELSFTMKRTYGYGTLELFIEEVSHGTIDDPTWGGNQSGTPLHFIVPAGEHDVKFVAAADHDDFESGKIPFILDLFECRAAEAKPGTNGYVDFDEGYQPPEVEGSWLISNAHSVNKGRAAIHPPPLRRGDTAEMTFSCDASKVELTMRRRYGYGSLSLMVDEVDYGFLDDPTWGGNQSGTPLSFVLPPGEHTFAFLADADQQEYADGRVPYLLDSFRCSTTEAELGPNGYVDFDAGYVPPEVAGSWLLNNSIGTVDGDGAMHPPPLDPGDSAEMTFEFEGSQVSFTMRRRSGYGTLELVIDGEDAERIVLNDPTWGGNQSGSQLNFEQLGSGKHTLTFIASADEASPPRLIPFVLDAFSYE